MMDKVTAGTKRLYNSSKDSSSSSSDDEEVVEGKDFVGVDSDFGVPLRRYVTLSCYRGDDTAKRTSGASLTSVSADASGSRVCAGFSDGRLVLWDFASAGAQGRPFFETRDIAKHEVLKLRWSSGNPGGKLLCVARDSQVRLLDRDARQVAASVRGDMYLHDQRKTAGHTAAAADGAWASASVFATASIDGTVRTWDARSSFGLKKHVSIVAAPKARRVRFSSIAYSKENSPVGLVIAAGAEDGTVRTWFSHAGHVAAAVAPANGNAFSMIKHTSAVRTLEFGPPNTAAERLLLTRGGGELCVWDLRKPSSALMKWKQYDHGDDDDDENDAAVWAPHGRFIACAVNADYTQRCARVAILDGATSASELTPLPISETQNEKQPPWARVRCLEWHERLNQIIVGRDDGSCDVRYHPVSSFGGALLMRPQVEEADLHESADWERIESAAYRPSAQKRAAGTAAEDARAVREALREAMSVVTKEEDSAGDYGVGSGSAATGVGRIMTREELHAWRKQRADAREKRLPSKAPAARVPGGGVLWDGMARDTTRDADPREAILRYAEAAAKDPKWVTPAYAHTQPKTVLADHVVEPDEADRVLPTDDRQRSVKRRRPNNNSDNTC